MPFLLVVKSAIMTREERLIAQYGEDAVRKAKELSAKCPANYFIVEDHVTNTVYYKEADPPNSIIKTDYTAEHIRIAFRGFMEGDAHHIRWNRDNSTLSKGQRDYYNALGK